MRTFPSRVLTTTLLVAVTQIAPFGGAAQRDDRSALTSGVRVLQPPARGPVFDTILTVDKKDRKASDRNPGTPTMPLKTIGEAVRRAVNRNRRDLSVRILIRPGIYRESLFLNGSRSTAAGIVLQGSAEGGVVISGSDPMPGWSQAEGGAYSHPWLEKWGLTPLPAGWDRGYAGDYLARNPIIRRREMVFVNDLLLEQVDSLQALADKQNGAFFVSEERGLIYMAPPAGIDPARASVEVAIRPNLLTVDRMKSVTIQGLIFEHASTALDGKAVSIANSSDIEILDSNISRNNWLGLGFYRSRNIIVRRTVANHNGVGGIAGYDVNGLLLEDTQTSFNNWRGSMGWDRNAPSGPLDANFIDFATGQKFFRLRDATFRRHESSSNLTGGLWFDYDNSGVTLENVTLRENLTHGLFVEASQGPVSLTNSLVCNNETGVLIANSSNGTLSGNVFSGNSLGNLFVAGQDSPRSVQDSRSGKQLSLETREWTINETDFRSDGTERALATYLADQSWQTFVSTLRSTKNVWIYDQTDEIFQISGGSRLNLAEWQLHSGQDTDSISMGGANQFPACAS